jgi:predicted NUDIX family NTP pyrophosphohydrolase
VGDHHGLNHEARAAGSCRILLRLASSSLNSSKTSAGLLLYRRAAAGLELFLAHPGGPFWRGRDAGAWTIPKGIAEPGEDLLAAACREFEEETGVRPTGPFVPLGVIRQKAGKLVHAWAWEGDADPANVRSNTMKTEWPRGSGRWLTFPEVDRCAWFTPDEARSKINPAQGELIDRLESTLFSPPPTA